MRRLLCVALLASLGFPLGAHAAPATNIGCTAALRLSPETFSTVYTTRAHDLSEISQDAYHYWGTCEREATTKALAGNAALMAHIATLRDHFVRPSSRSRTRLVQRRADLARPPPRPRHQALERGQRRSSRWSPNRT